MRPSAKLTRLSGPTAIARSSCQGAGVVSCGFLVDLPADVNRDSISTRSTGTGPGEFTLNLDRGVKKNDNQYEYQREKKRQPPSFGPFPQSCKRGSFLTPVSIAASAGDRGPADFEQS